MTTLEDLLREAFASGSDEVVLRVSRYGADGVTPEAFQSLVKQRDRTRQWAVGIRGNAPEALRAALTPKPPVAGSIFD